MSTQLVLHGFNTGCRYTPEGQRIVWSVIVINGCPRTVFVDLDRGIDGVLTGITIDDPDNVSVLRQYREGAYNRDAAHIPYPIRDVMLAFAKTVEVVQ